MRYILTFAIMLCLFASCEKNDGNIIEEPKENTYVIKDIEFFLSDDDRVDSIRKQLDTLTYVNYSSSLLPDTTFYPYKSFRDSLNIELIDPFPEDLVFEDSLGFRHMIIREDNLIGYVSQDSTYISKFPSTLVLPLRNIDETVTFKPNPKTRYDITGEYWRVRYSISFRAEALSIKDDIPITLNGKLKYSTVTGNPLTLIVIASEVP
jgi:hypothetical protein